MGGGLAFDDLNLWTVQDEEEMREAQDSHLSVGHMEGAQGHLHFSIRDERSVNYK
jgi:hypothetical protein